MAWLELAEAGARGLHLAAVLCVFGAATFWWGVAHTPLQEVPNGRRTQMWRRMTLLVRASAAAALGLGVIWLILKAAGLAQTASVADTLGAVSRVLRSTMFGHALLARGVLLAAAVAAFGAGGAGRGAIAGAAAILLAGAACAAQAWMGHAAAVREIALPASVIIHVLAAGAWLAGLVPLWLTLHTLPPGQAVSRIAKRFSVLGVMCVLALAVTALVQGRELIGSIPRLVGTEYGVLAMAKLGMFLLLLVLAVINRIRLTPRLAGGDAVAAGHLRLSVAIETAIGLIVVLTAARLAELLPGAHEQPNWPFAWRLSSTAFSPDLRGEVVPALSALAGAIALGVASLFWRRVRWPGLVLALIAAVAAAPHLGPLFVPAYPTTFYESMSDFSVDTIVHGSELFAANCVICHGPEGRGNGPLAKSLPIPPLDLTAPHVFAHLDGDMFWWLTHGYDDPSGSSLAMPGFEVSLSEEDRWDLIDYVRGHAAGVEYAAQGSWPVPIQAPEMDIGCRGSPESSMADLRGRPIRIIALDAAPPVVPEELTAPGLTTIVMPRRPPPRAISGCASREPDAWRAYAIVAGIAPDALAGTEFLVDSRGWLRALWRPGAATPDAITMAVRTSEANPIRSGAVTHRHH
jgi:putative copper export protein/mono/diheme cytochrome c family protein